MSRRKAVQVSNPILPNLSEYTKVLEKVWANRQLSNFSEQNDLLEHKLKTYMHANNISLFASGMTALMAAIQLLSIDGEVITTPFTYMATPHALSWNGLMPVFCDINSDDLCIDASKIESCITPRTSAILAVHIFGNPCDNYNIQRIADKHGLKVIYDAAHAFDVKINDFPIVNWGDVSMLSFHFTKLFHTAEGGALCINNTSLAEKSIMLRRFGCIHGDYPEFPGLNGKMSELQAAMGLLVLDMVNDEQKKRKRVRDYYIKCLSDIGGMHFIDTPKQNLKPSYQYLIAQILPDDFGCSRGQVLTWLKQHNIHARDCYPLCSNFPYYKESSLQTANFPHAKAASEECMMLPYWGDMGNALIEEICELIIKTPR